MSNPLRRSAAPLTDGELAMFESRTGLTLPPAYRAFLLASNGGVPRRNRFYHRNKKGQKRETWVRYFYPLGRAGLIDPDVTDLEVAWQVRPAGLPAGVLAVGNAYFLGNEGAVCVACEGADAGQVFFRPEVEGSKTTLYYVAADWDTFLGEMEFEDGKERAWKTAIEDGDVPRLREWLEKHRRRWREDGGLAIEIERAAVEENGWPAVELLMGLGFEPSSLFSEALSYNRFEMALRLLETGRVSRDAIATCLGTGNVYLWHVPPLLEALVAAGADVNHEGDTGDTPLHVAVEARSEAGVRFLLEKGADPTVQNDDRRTPLGLARRLEETKLAAMLQEGERAWAARPRAVEPDVRELDLCGVELTDGGPALTLEEIRAAEKGLGVDFTPEYRWLLLQSNGGVPRPNVLPLGTSEGDIDGEELDDDEEEDDGAGGAEPTVELLRLRRGQGRMLEGMPGHRYEGDTVESARGWYHDGSEIPRGMVPIGALHDYGCEGAGYLLLGCKGRQRGQLFAFDHGEERLNLTLPQLFEALSQAAARPKDAGQKLADAVEARDLAAVRAALEEGARAERPTLDGRWPLALAAKAGFEEALLAMLDAGVKVDEVFTAAVDENQLDFARGLLDRKPAPSKRLLADLLAYRPNLMARMDVVLAIVGRGVKVKHKLPGGHTLLHAAATSGSEEVMTYFLDQGLDVNAKTEEGETPLHRAAVAESGSGAMVRLLLARGAKVSQPKAGGETALHGAIRAGNAEAAKALIDAGEGLHAKFEVVPPGMSPEQARQQAQRISQMMAGGLDSLLGLDDDGPPPPDTSEPAGEKAAGLMDAMGQMMQRMQAHMGGMQARLEAMGRGSWGQGQSAAEAAGETEEGRALLAELEAYARARPRPPEA